MPWVEIIMRLGSELMHGVYMPLTWVEASGMTRLEKGALDVVSKSLIREHLGYTMVHS